MTASQPDTHLPVMLDEVLRDLAPREGGAYVDGTFGAGGYSRAILGIAGTSVWAIDRDPDAVARGEAMATGFTGRLTMIHGRFADMADLLGAAGADRVDGVVFDLGVSSPQLDAPARGFSFRFDGPLDMRMDRSGPTAADVVNTMAEGDLAGLIRRLGEERFARRVARAIVEARGRREITGTGELAEIVRGAVPQGRSRIDPATRTFMALRMHVNDELGQLDRGLAAAEEVLAPGGRLVVVSFHSLEDRRVKTFLHTRSGALPSASRHLPPSSPRRPPSFRLLRRGAAKAGAAETDRNPRARSARLRAAERTPEAAWPREEAA